MEIFEVEIKTTVCVVAANYLSAEDKAYNSLEDIIRENDDYEITTKREPLELDDLPSGWDGLCIPYGGDGNTRIKDIK